MSKEKCVLLGNVVCECMEIILQCTKECVGIVNEEERNTSSFGCINDETICRSKDESRLDSELLEAFLVKAWIQQGSVFLPFLIAVDVVIELAWESAK